MPTTKKMTSAQLAELPVLTLDQAAQLLQCRVSTCDAKHEPERCPVW